MPEAKKRLVIFLHGWAQNAFVMKSRTAKLEKKLTKAGYECMYLEAPHLLPMTSTVTIEGKEVQITNGERENARAWFTYSKTDSADASMALSETSMEYIGLDASVNRVRKFFIQHCNCNNEGDKDEDSFFCAIFGFSQGATFCHILSMLASNAAASKNANNKDPLSNIHCAIMLSGFPSMHIWDIRDNDSQHSSEELQQMKIAKDDNNLLNVKSLHIYGEKDTSVPKLYSKKLAGCFSEPEIYVHEKGHVIPHNAPLCERVIKFLGDSST